jgi:hypothetical protein
VAVYKLHEMRLKQDSRSKQFSYSKSFGSTYEFPSEFLIKDSIPDAVQTPGNVECTAITCCDIASDKDSIVYDYDNLYNRIPHNTLGASPQDALSETVKNGLLPKGGAVLIKDFSSYWSAHDGEMSPFDNVRSALLLAKYPVAIWTNWYSNWYAEVLPVGDKVVSAHMYTIEGWKVINGVTMLQIEAWTGHKLYMPKETFENAVSQRGCGTAVLSTTQIDLVHRRDIMTRIIDLAQNVILLLNRLMQISQTDTKAPPNTPQSVSSPVSEQTALPSRFYLLCRSFIGQHLTLDSSVPAAYGCAEALSYCLKEFGYPMLTRGIASTIGMNDWLSKNCDVVETPDVGDIIISITQGNNHGHVGVVGVNSIMSNDSQTGNWECFWSLPAWLEYYQTQKKLVTKFYRLRELLSVS